MQCPKIAIFDLDETLALSLQIPSRRATEGLVALLERIPVCIMTGRKFEEVQSEFLDPLTISPHAKRLYFMASGASKGFRFEEGAWREVFSHELTKGEREVIRRAIEETVEETNALKGLPCYGECYIDKGTMLTFAMLGVSIPEDAKRSWDPGNVQRKKFWSVLAPKLPTYDVFMGGFSAIDITRKGINKAYGVKWLAEKLKIAPSDMLYVGDALYEGGNDAVVIPTGIQTRSVSGPEETLTVLDELLRACGT